MVRGVTKQNGEGASQVLPLQNGGGGGEAEKVLAVMKGGHKSFFR